MKGSRNSVRMSNNRMVVCGLVVVLILVGLYFLAQRHNLLGGNVRENFESQPMELNNLTEKPNPGANDVIIVLFYVDWCPHCVSTKPEWEKLKAESNLGVRLEEVDCSDSNNTPALATEYGVSGFPTLILVNGSNKVTYEGERTKEALVSFIKDNY